jgi:DNA modification methylase
MKNQVLLGDCLEVMKDIPDGSIDMILCDLPYGTTKCKWDIIIPFEPLWEEYHRVTKRNGAIILTASQPFTSVLINSNLKDYRYNWVWEKSKATGYLNAKKMPMKAHEDVCVFYRKLPVYNPQMWQGTPYNKGSAHRPTEVYGKQKEVLVKNDTGLRYPRTVQYFKTAESEGKVLHPTQKPVSMFEYLIQTYSNKDDIILDNCAGVGTTALAAIKSERKYICIEKDKNYYQIMNERIAKLENEKC